MIQEYPESVYKKSEKIRHPNLEINKKTIKLLLPEIIKGIL